LSQDNGTGQTPPRPSPLTVRPEGIPAELQEGKRFVLWKYDFRKGKWTKPPYQPNGKLAGTTDPATWSTFAEVLAAYRQGGWDGIGRIHLPEDNLVGADADHCVAPDTGEVSGADAEAVLSLATYTEVSPSGTGLRAFCRGRKPGRKCKNGAFEIYDGLTKKGEPGGRYLTLTGHHLDGSPATVNDRQAEVEAVYNRYFGAKQKLKASERQGAKGGRIQLLKVQTFGGPCPLPLTPGELRRWNCVRADKTDRIRALWGGDASAYRNAAGEVDDSRADAALCIYLLILTNGDRRRAEQLFGQSALGKRPKWTDRQDYRDLTFNFALDGFEPWKDDPAQHKDEAEEGGDEPPAPEGGKPPRTFAPVILAWLRENLAPTFKRGAQVYSQRLGRQVSRTEVHPDNDIIDRLVKAGAAEIDRKGNVDLRGLPKVFRDWLPVAWGQLLKDLPEEGADGEFVEPAEKEFRARLTAVFSTVVALGYSYRKFGDREDRHEVMRDPIIDWAARFAKGPRWESVRGFRIWSKKTRDGQIHVAFRAELIGQLHCPGWGTVDQDRLSHLCRLYAVGMPCKVAGGTARAIELTPEFLADLLDSPVNEPETDTRTASAFACEGEECPGVRGSNQSQAQQGDNWDGKPGHPPEKTVQCPGSVSGSTRTPNPDTKAENAPGVRVECPGGGDREINSTLKAECNRERETDSSSAVMVSGGPCESVPDEVKEMVERLALGEPQDPERGDAWEG
jgi:hypothetical protein